MAVIHKSGKDDGVCFVSTFRNDEAGVELLLDSLLRQTRLPDEVVLVDGGSPTSLLRMVEGFEKRAGDLGIGMRIVKRPGCNIAEGRNTAIEHSSFDVIASSDAGCSLDSSWLKEITSPFCQEDVEMVAGTYRPVTKNAWERAVAAFLMPDPDRIAVKLPSARSVAFRKSVWEAVGGFPEKLNHAEDTYFVLRARYLGMKMIFSGRALVTWRPRRNPVSFFRQILFYSIGDGTAGVFTGYYARKIILLCTAIVTLVLVPSLSLLIVTLSGLLGATLILLYRRVPGELRGTGTILLLFPVFVIHLAAQATGFSIGFLRRIFAGTGLPHPGKGSRGGQR